MPDNSYYRRNRDKCKADSKKYRLEHSDRIREYRKVYDKSPHYRELRRRYVRKLHDKVIDKLGGKCCTCGIVDKRVLQINHIKGGGTKEYHKGGAVQLYIDILAGRRTTEDLNILCANCNWIARWERMEKEEQNRVIL